MSKRNTAHTPLPHPIPAQGELGPLVGRNFGGYEITSYIGEGPTGSVYRAEDLIGSRMAMKVMHSELSRREPAERLWADLQTLSRLGGPHFLEVHDSGFAGDGAFYYVMDELPGCDLEAGLEETGALAPGKTLEIVRQLCDALEAAHAAGVVHGGLKPRNVFLMPGDTGLTVKVLDFGAARMAGGLDKGVIVGNPFYMAPEQFGGLADVRTDVYSLGVLMYELFSGALPFTGPSQGRVMMRHLVELPEPPAGVDAELGGIILRALVKVPADRIQSIHELRDALERWVKTGPGMLADVAAFHVAARAAEARAMKQAVSVSPDTTVPMPKMDLAELARAARLEVTAAPPKPDANSNSSESVEASLEDFISQANASFPTSAASDGWDLHTGDVELVDEDHSLELEKEEQISAPIQSKPVAAPRAQPKPQRNSKPAIQAVAAAPQYDPEPTTPADSQNFSDLGEDSDSLDDDELAPASAPRRKIERTEIVGHRTHSVPWTANPLVIIGGLLAAFIVGAGLVFFMVRAMLPTQPIVVQAPPALVAAPAAPVARPAQPIVTQLPAPVVTPLPAPVAAPVPAPEAVAPTPAPNPKDEEPAPAPERRRAPTRIQHPKAVQAPVRREAPPKREAPAPAKRAEPVRAAPPKAAAPAKAKKESKGSDWVDPFAQ